MTAFAPIAGLAGRILLSLIFILSGLQKFGAADMVAQYMESKGLPGFLVYPTAIFETFGGLAIATGFYARPVALLLAGFCLVAGVFFHTNFADQVQMVMFLKNLALTGAFLLVFRDGAGPYSLDARAGR